MKVVVDEEVCTGCGLCAETCPEVFEMDGDMAKVIGDTVPAAAESTCREAVEGCPVSAISIQA
jgi:ferredoxin